MQTSKMETLELVYEDGISTITIPIPLPVAETRSRGINATTHGFNWKMRFSPTDAQLIEDECNHLGTSRMQFIRSAAVEAAKALRRLRHDKRVRDRSSDEGRESLPQGSHA